MKEIPVFNEFGVLIGSFRPADSGLGLILTILWIAFALVVVLPFFLIFMGFKALIMGKVVEAILCFIYPGILLGAILLQGVVDFNRDHRLCRQVEVTVSAQENTVYVETGSGPKYVGVSINGKDPESWLVGMGRGGTTSHKIEEPLERVELVYVWKYHYSNPTKRFFEECNMVITK